MCGSAPKQKISQAEIEQSKVALARLNEYETDGYKDLEKAAIADAHGRDRTAAYQRVGNASLNDAAGVAEQQARQFAGQGSAFMQLADNEDRLRTVATQAHSDTAVQTSAGQDEARLNMLRVGRDIAGDVSKNSALAAARGASQQRNKLEIQSLKDEGKVQMLNSAIKGYRLGQQGRKDWADKEGMFAEGTLGGRFREWVQR